MNLAEDIEDVLLPDALEYYLGLNDDLFDMEGQDSEDEDGAGGDGSDGGDSDEDKKPKKKGKGGDKKGGADAAAAGQQECKQQWLPYSIQSRRINMLSICILSL